MMKTIRIAAALLVRPDGQTLLVRKRGTDAFMQPGGKIDAGETPADCLVRELREELELHVDAHALTALGQFEAQAANEPEHMVLADVFVIRTERSDIRPAAEIEEVRWVSPFAPLTADHILPEYRKRVG